MPSTRDVLAAWFPPSIDSADQFSRWMRRWTPGGVDAGDEVLSRLGPLADEALAGRVDAWADTSDGRLALVVLLGAFPRVRWPDTARAYAGDEAAARIAEAALRAGDDRALPVERRLLLVLALLQVEDLRRVERAAVLLEGLVGEAPDWARASLGPLLGVSRACVGVLARFGRFPMRNRALGRDSTPEEEMFLAGFEPPAGCRT